MPKGRPRLPGTPEERAAARRRKVLQNVRAHRLRKRSKDISPNLVQPEETRDSKSVEEPAISDHALEPIREEIWPSLSPDISHFSDKPPIELSFGFGPTIVRDFQNLIRRYPFVTVLEKFQTPDKIVGIATFAAAAATLGVRAGDERLKRIGNASYANALQKLRGRVCNMTASQLPMLAVVSNCLMAFENANGSQRTYDSPWGAHALGSALFLELAGPEAYNSDTGRLILRCHRQAIVQIHVYARKRCFLDQEAWRTVPFQNGTKTAEDHIWEIAASLPGHMVEAENLGRQLLQRDEKAEKSASRLKTRISRTIQQYQDWMTSLQANPLSRFTESGSSDQQFSRHVPEGVFPRRFIFANAHMSELYMVYWTSMLNLHMLVRALQRGLVFSGLTTSAAELDDLLPGVAREIANNICMGMEDCIGPDELNLNGTIYAGFLPLQTATRFFKTNPLEYEKQIMWCESVAALVSSRGLHTHNYLDHTGGGCTMLWQMYERVLVAT